MGSDGVGGSRRIAKPLAMRLDIEPDVFRAGFADAPPTSKMHRRCIVGASAMQWRCGATLRPHLLGPHLGGP
eukprot:582763-Pyramimonas_sp.AAC.1